MGSNIFGIKGEPKFALQNFEVRGNVLVEEMHTPETKSTIFQKNSPSVGDYLVILRIKCLLLGQEAPIFHMIFTWNKLISYY